MAARKQEPLYVAFSMDCTPPGTPSTVPGPGDWDEARRAMASFAEAIADESLKGTFFVAPECLGRLKEAVNELLSAEMELGMLCHPQLANYEGYLGSYGYDLQREIIGVGKAVWRDKLGEDPVNFRPGFFSANDYTFQILCTEGFSQGSCSLPGRVAPEQCSLWQKSYPFAHHTDPLDRKITGSMEFFEVPVTSDFEAKGVSSNGEPFTPRHLRVEAADVSEQAESLINKHLNRMEADRPDVRSIVFVTHNSVGWGEEEDPHLERLHNLASLLRGIAEKRKMELVPASLDFLHREADRRWRGARELRGEGDVVV